MSPIGLRSFVLKPWFSVLAFMELDFSFLGFLDQTYPALLV